MLRTCYVKPASIHDRYGKCPENAEHRQVKYLNNIVEQDHRAIKRRLRPMLGLKTFHTARRLIAGIETMHMIAKGQMNCPKGASVSAAEQFYSLAA